MLTCASEFADANLKITNRKGYNALSLAEEKKYKDIAAFLKNHGEEFSLLVELIDSSMSTTSVD